MLVADSNIHSKAKAVDTTNDLDKALLLRIIDKDHQAFQQLYLAYHDHLYRFMFRMLRQHDQVSALVDDVMLVVWQNARSFRGQSKASTWIMGIAHRIALKAYRKNKQYSERHNTEQELEQIADQPEAGPEHTTYRHQIQKIIQQGLNAISADKRSVVELTMRGYSYSDIAEIVQCPVNTVKTRMFHARRELSAFLGDSRIANEFLTGICHD